MWRAPHWDFLLLLLLRVDNLQMKLFKLLLFHEGRRVIHRTDSRGVLRERDHFVNRAFTGHDHDDPVDSRAILRGAED